jgi:hypothetical protein
MAEEMQGIMALPEGQQEPRGQIDPSKFSPVVESYAKNSPREFGRDILGGMAEADPAMTDEFIRELAAMKLPPEVIDALQLMVDNILANPETYAVDRAEFIQEGVPEELLPDQFDPAYFAAFNLALDQLDINKEPAVPTFADGGIINVKTISKELSDMGRGGDTMLAHITPEEMRLLRSRGGSGTINPDTGLPEFGLFKKIKKAVGKVVKTVAKVVKKVAAVVKKVAKSPIGKIILTAAAVYFMGPAGFNLAGGMGLTGATAMGVNTFAGSTLVNLASGQKLGQAIKGGAIAGAMAGVASYALSPSAPPPSGPAPVVEGSFTPTTGQGISAIPPSAVPDVSTFDISQGVQGAQGLQGIQGIPMPAAPAPMPTVQAPMPTAPTIGATPAPIVEGGFTPNAGYVPPPPPGVMDLVKEGRYGDAASAAYKTISPSAIQAEGSAAAQKAGMDAISTLPANTPNAVISSVYEKAYTAAMPGVLSTYGPIAAVGLGAAYLGGAFKPEPVAPPSNIDQFTTTGKDLLARDPSTYGLTYGGGSTTYAPNPYNNMYSAGLANTTTYQGNPYDNIYSNSSAPYPTARLAAGGIASLEDFPRKNGPIDGPGTGTSDSVPAMLSDGEFVFTARAVRAMGQGSRRKGAKRMYKLMKQLESKGK